MIEQIVRRARQLKTETLALTLAYRDPRTPWYARLVLGVVIAYALSPIDLIPDVIPVLGYLDDLILVPLGIAVAIRLLPPGVMDDCRAQARLMEGKGGSSSWLGVGIVTGLWALSLLIAFVIGVRLFT